MRLRRRLRRVWRGIQPWLPTTGTLVDLSINVAVPVLIGIYQAAGRTIETGNQGLKFSLGRPTRVCEPGFYPLFPYLQTIREVPARSRTLDPPTQVVTTTEGLVYKVDANMTWRIVDIHKALIDVKDLEHALRDVFAIGVQEVVSHAHAAEIREHDVLDQRLTERLAGQAGRWGVRVEEAGFVTLAPTPETLRVTQLGAVVRARRDAVERMNEGGLRPTLSLGAVGMRRRLVSVSRQRRPQEHAARWRRERDVQRALVRRQPDPSAWVQLKRWLFGEAASTVNLSEPPVWLDAPPADPTGTS